MVQYMKKSSFGRMISTDDINDAEEVRMSVEEYEALLKRIHQAEHRIDEINEEVEEDVKNIYRDANRQLEDFKKKLKDTSETAIRVAGEYRREAEKNAEQSLEREKALSEENVRLAEKVNRLTELNDSLQRISRERSNAKRGLTPKKEHSGYVIISSRDIISTLPFGAEHTAIPILYFSLS